MAFQTINIGSVANDGTGDNMRVAGGKINANNAALMPYTGITRAQISSYAPVNGRFITSDGAPWIPGASAGPMATQDSLGAWWQIDTSANVQVGWFGALGDVTTITAAVTIASGDAALTVAGAAFTAADVGNAISITGADAASATLYTTITGFTSATQVTLADNAGTALFLVNQTVAYGTDDTAAFGKAFAVLPAGGVVMLDPNKTYYATPFTVPDYVTLRGGCPRPDQARGSAFNYHYDTVGKIVMPSTSLTVTSSGSSAAAQNVIHVGSTTGIKVGSIVSSAATGIYFGSIVSGVNPGASTITLSVNLSAIVPDATSLTIHNPCITLGNSAGLEDLIVMKFGMPEPDSADATFVAEVATWANGALCVSGGGYGSKVERCALLGFYCGVSVLRVDRQHIENNNIDCWCGIQLGSSGDLPRVKGNHLWSFYAYTATGGDLAHRTYRGGPGIYLMYACVDIQVHDCFSLGHSPDFWVRDAARVRLFGCHADGDGSVTTVFTSKRGFVIEGSSPFFYGSGLISAANADNYFVDLYDSAGTALTYGPATFDSPVGFASNNAVYLSNYRCARGGMVLVSPGAQNAYPVQTDTGCNLLIVFHPKFNSANTGVVNAFNLNVTPGNFIVIGGQFGSFTNNGGTRFNTSDNPLIDGLYLSGSTGIYPAATNATPIGDTTHLFSAAYATKFMLGATLGISHGTGAPAGSAAKGSLYIRDDPAGATSRLYINTDGATTWANVTCSA
jgi:hypothetical protein